MLTLITGRGKSGKTTRLFQMIKECPGIGMTQRILIVPEQLSHQTERALAAVCGDGISYVSEVLSFTRLQNRVSAMYGGGARKTLDEGGRILTARLALSNVQSQLKVFAAASGKSEFLDSILTMIDEFKSYDVVPKQLIDASKKTDGLFSQKLLELGIILDAYNAVMARGVYDPRDKMVLLREQLLETEYASERYFFVDGFTDFSAQELDVLDALLRRSKHVTVTVPCDSDNLAEEPFRPGQETVARLLQMAMSNGHQVQTICVEHQREIPKELVYMEQNLFSYQASVYSAPCPAIKIICGNNQIDECRHCVAEIRRLAMQGKRWRDMAVAVGNVNTYGPILEELCKDYGVPLYTGEKSPVTAHPAVAFLLCGLEAALEGMETEVVTAYLKTGYTGISLDDCDAIENYAYTWSIRGQNWNKKWAEHPDGYDGKFVQDTYDELARLNTLKQHAVDPLLHLSTRLKSAGNIRAQIMAIYRFLEETELFSQVNNQLKDLTRSGDIESAQEMAQIWNTLMECLQQIVAVLGEMALNGNEFLKILRLALGQYKLGTIPAVLDAVHFGGMDTIRGMEPQVLFVLGANEGNIPNNTYGNRLLTEQERRVLQAQMNLQLAPDMEGTMERQFLQIYSALTAPSEKIYLSYTMSSAGEQAQPSFLVKRIQTLFPKVMIKEIDQQPMDFMTPETLTELYFSAEESGNTELKESIAQTAKQVPKLEQTIISAKAAALPRNLTVSSELTTKLFGMPIVLTASRLDKFGNCPLSFFLDYGIKAKKRKEAAFDAAEFGTFLHYMLEQTVQEMTCSNYPMPLSELDSSQLVKKYMSSYLEQRVQNAEELSSRQKYLYFRNGSEADLLLMEISQELSVSEFRPCAYELRFGKGEQLGTLEIEGELGYGRLDGMVDRVDLWKGPHSDYFRIIDYKSGTKKFDYTDLYGGVGMQLMLYLFALEQVGVPGAKEHPIPAGALYFPAKQSILSVNMPITATETEKLRRKSGSKRTGIVLADETVLEAMEHGGGEQYLPVQKKKHTLGDFAVTPEQMNILKSFVQHQMSKVIDQIYTGSFVPNPFYRGQSHDPCQWCDYGDICQKDKKFRSKHYHPSLSAKEFWELIGGNDNG